MADDLTSMIEGFVGNEVASRLKGSKSSGPAADDPRYSAGEKAAGIGEDILIDEVASRLLPDNGPAAQRDAKDAHNADTAFTAILAVVMAALETPTVVAGIAADVATLGAGTPAHATVQGAITAAGVAVRVAWGKLSVEDKAHIWRGEA